MKMRKFIFGAFVLTVICFSFSIALGETVKRAISFPQDVDEEKVVEAAMNECMKMNYDLQKEEGKTIFRKKHNIANQPHKGQIFSIKLSVDPGEHGKKVLTLDGELIGDHLVTVGGPNLDQDVNQVEKAVKKYIEPR